MLIHIYLATLVNNAFVLVLCNVVLQDHRIQTGISLNIINLLMMHFLDAS